MRDLLGNPVTIGDIVVLGQPREDTGLALATLNLARVVRIYEDSNTAEVIYLGTEDHNRYANPSQLLVHSTAYRDMHPQFVSEIFTAQATS